MRFREQELNRVFETVMSLLSDPDVMAELNQDGDFDIQSLRSSEGLDESLVEDDDGDDDNDETNPEKEANIFKLLQGMKLPQRVKLALFGNRSARQILLKDSNRMVQMMVLQNPRITENEICDAAKNTNTDDQVLRNIAGNSQWMKSYQMKSSVVFNAKTPVDISIKWVKFLNPSDLKKLSKSKNIPQVLATQARKLSEK